MRMMRHVQSVLWRAFQEKRDASFFGFTIYKVTSPGEASFFPATEKNIPNVLLIAHDTKTVYIFNFKGLTVEF